VKTTLEIPDELFRSAKARAAEEGLTLKAYVVAALKAKLKSEGKTEAKPWMKHFGSLSHLRKETRRIEKIIEDEFETINLEDWK
jgi:hypothetical protein